MAGKVDLKVVLLGKEYGGKTSLVERYIHGKFNSNAPYQSVSDLGGVWRAVMLAKLVDACVCCTIEGIIVLKQDACNLFSLLWGSVTSILANTC